MGRNINDLLTLSVTFSITGGYCIYLRTRKLCLYNKARGGLSDPLLTTLQQMGALCQIGALLCVQTSG